jgi:hypothetical protein
LRLRLGPLFPLLLFATLANCRLIDQSTFERAPETPDPAALARPVLPARPLLRLVLSDPTLDWRPAVAEAARLARARKPDAAFDVLAPVPTDAKREVQDRYVRQGQTDTRMVAAALQADGIDPGRITLGLQGDAGTPPREVRIYVH